MYEPNKFETDWKRFMTSCRGKLMEKQETENLTASGTRIAVQAAVEGWLDPYGNNSGWFRDLRAKQPEAAKRVEEELRAIDFIKLPDLSKASSALLYGVPAATAAAGAAIGFVFKLSHLWIAGLTLAPAALIYPLIRQQQQDKIKMLEKNRTQEYMEQLELYKERIAGIATVVENESPEEELAARAETET